MSDGVVRVGRGIRSIVRFQDMMVAVADEGTLWIRTEDGPWEALEELPPRADGSRRSARSVLTGHDVVLGAVVRRNFLMVLDVDGRVWERTNDRQEHGRKWRQISELPPPTPISVGGEVVA